MSHTANSIYAFIQTLTPLYELLLPCDLASSDRQSLGSHCFQQAPELVRDTAAVLRDSGALFPEITLDPQALASDQEDADAVRALQAHMLVLGRLSGDAYLYLQAPAARAALDAFKRALAANQFQPERQLRFRLIALSRIALHVPRQHRTAVPAPAIDPEK